MIKDCRRKAGLLPPAEEILRKADGVCPVEWAMNVAETAMKNSCGRGTFCRDGMKQLYLIAKDITRGVGSAEDMELLEELCSTMSLVKDCELSAAAISLFQLSLREHNADWTAHVLRRRCRAGTCPGCTKATPVAAAGENRRRRGAPGTAPTAAEVSVAIPIVEIPTPAAEECVPVRITPVKPQWTPNVTQRRRRRGGIVEIIED